MNQDALATAAKGRRGLLARQPWLVFLLPFLVYMAVGNFEPTQPTPDNPSPAPKSGISHEHYPIVYTAKIALTIAAMMFVLPGYRQFPFRVSPLAIVVGVIGVVLWVWICHLEIERKLLAPLGLERLLSLGQRPAYNPLAELAATPAWAYTFLAIRFVGLAAVVPIIEEFFLRGFLMRFVVDQEWWKVPFGRVTPAAVVVGTVFPMLMHPAELFAAAVWFSLVTWLMVRTKNIWDCVAAHAVTNLLLGVYVVTYGQWQLW
ncbi:MAG: CAAX prenyl protease-related protein [Pirellulales bacterium]